MKMKIMNKIVNKIPYLKGIIIIDNNNIKNSP